MAAAGGLDINAVIQGLEKDKQQRKLIGDFLKAVGKFGPQVEEASVSPGAFGRDYSNIEMAAGMKLNTTGDGKNHPLSQKGKEVALERYFKKVGKKPIFQRKFLKMMMEPIRIN